MKRRKTRERLGLRAADNTLMIFIVEYSYKQHSKNQNRNKKKKMI